MLTMETVGKMGGIALGMSLQLVSWQMYRMGVREGFYELQNQEQELEPNQVNTNNLLVANSTLAKAASFFVYTAGVLYTGSSLYELLF
jgi:hypothetical protein